MSALGTSVIEAIVLGKERTASLQPFIRVPVQMDKIILPVFNTAGFVPGTFKFVLLKLVYYLL